MRKLTILCDMDSIIVDVSTPWYAEYNRRFDDNLSLDKVLDWDTHKFCRQDLLGVGHKVHPIYTVIEEPGFFLKLKPFPGAVEGVKALVDDGHRVLIVTAGKRYALTDKALSLDTFMPWFDHKNLITTHAKDVFKGDIIFDDGPHNLLAYRQAWPGAQLASVSYPYNAAALKVCDFIAGDWRDMKSAWANFVAWVRLMAEADPLVVPHIEVASYDANGSPIEESPLVDRNVPPLPETAGHQPRLAAPPQLRIVRDLT